MYCKKNGSIPIFEDYVNLNTIWLYNRKQIFDGVTLKNKIKSSIKNSINYHLKSDVPIGVLLSGGIDSSLILSQLRNKKNVLAITIHFEEFSDTNLDEVPRAKEITKLYNIKHYIRTVTRDEFKRLFKNYVIYGSTVY